MRDGNAGVCDSSLTALVATRRRGYARDIEKQILRFAQNDKGGANDSLAPPPLVGEGGEVVMSYRQCLVTMIF